MYVTAPSFVQVVTCRLRAVVCMYILYIYVWPKQPAGNFFIAFSHWVVPIFFFSPLSAIKSVIHAMRKLRCVGRNGRLHSRLSGMPRQTHISMAFAGWVQ